MKHLFVLSLVLISCIATGQAFEWDYKPVDFSGTPPGVDADSSHSWDAIHYEMQLQVTPVSVPNNLTLDGEVIITLEPEVSGLDTVDLHFHGLIIDAIDLGGTPCNYTRDGDMLYVALPSAYYPGDTLNLHIAYSGTPEITTNLTPLGIFYPNANLIYTQADPFGARNWLPCWDEPWDKATFSQKLWLPEEFLVASNGNLVATVPAPPYRLWWYSMDYPMTTYLLTFSASNYETIEQTAGDVQIRHFVYPSHLAAAQYDLERVPEMIQLYEEKFGPYPFDTYGYAENSIFSGFGAMENQTMVSLGSNLITGNRTYEDIVAHELGHMWFGDAVSYIDWPEMWLSEGFATYSEALWSEHIGGSAAYFANMQQKQATYYGWENPANPIPMYDPPWNQIWSAVTYEKGASVLHMLRYHLGDDDFFNMIQTYVSTYLYGNASTQDFNAVVNQVTGEDWSWYFDQWVYEGGYPIFEYFGTTQTVGDDVTLLLSVAQTQHEATPRFQTDADLYLFTAGDTTIERISIDALDTQQIELVLAEAPDSVQLDPLSWILGMKNRRDDITVPDLAVSSPLIDDEGGDGFLDPGESGDFSFIITNSGAPTSDLTVDIATDDEDLTIIDGSSAVPGVAFNGQVDLAGNPFEIENALGTSPRWVDFSVEISETSSGTTLAALDLSVPIGTPEILLVDDDEGGIAEINHQTALNEIRYVYRTVEYTSAGELPDLADYSAVIWACGAALTNTITQDDYDLISDYLENLGGNFILSGRGVVPDLDQQGFLGLFEAFYTGTTSALVLDGFDPIVQGMMFSITGDGANQDVMDIPTQMGVDFLLNYVGIDGSAAVMCYSDYKAVIFGFGFEDITANSPVFNEPYELMAAILDWFGVVPVVEDDPHAPLPADFRVTGVYPNPFNPTTTLSFDLPVASHVRLDIFDITGARIGVGLAPTRRYTPGSHAITYDGSDLASGVYIYRLEAGEFIATGKMVLLK